MESGALVGVAGTYVEFRQDESRTAGNQIQWTRCSGREGNRLTRKKRRFFPSENASVHTDTHKEDNRSSSPPVEFQPQQGAQNTSNCFLASDLLVNYIHTTQPANYYTLTLTGTKADAVASRALPPRRARTHPSVYRIPEWQFRLQKTESTQFRGGPRTLSSQAVSLLDRRIEEGKKGRGKTEGRGGAGQGRAEQGKRGRP